MLKMVEKTCPDISLNKKTMNQYNHNSCKSEPHKHRELKTKHDFWDLRCKPHQVCFCKCGWEWGKHPHDTSQHIPKNECQTCGEIIDSRYYETRGNFCGTCCGDADKRVKGYIKKDK